MRLWRAFKNLFGPRSIDFDGPIDPKFISNKNIPEVVFERDVGMYNYGYDKKKGMYKVLICPLERDIEV